MTSRRNIALAAALVAAALFAAMAYVAWRPEVLVRAEFARQLHHAGLSKHARNVAGHRCSRLWVGVSLVTVKAVAGCGSMGLIS